MLAAGDKLIDRDAEGKKLTPDRGLLTREKLGSHVGRRPHDTANRHYRPHRTADRIEPDRAALRCHRSSQTEVTNACCPFPVDEHVRGLDVSVEDAVLVNGVYER